MEGAEGSLLTARWHSSPPPFFPRIDWRILVFGTSGNDGINIEIYISWVASRKKKKNKKNWISLCREQRMLSAAFWERPGQRRHLSRSSFIRWPQDLEKLGAKVDHTWRKGGRSKKLVKRTEEIERRRKRKREGEKEREKKAYINIYKTKEREREKVGKKDTGGSESLAWLSSRFRWTCILFCRKQDGILPDFHSRYPGVAEEEANLWWCVGILLRILQRSHQTDSNKKFIIFLSISQVGTAIIHFKKRVRFLEMFLSWKYADKADYDRALATGG